MKEFKGYVFKAIPTGIFDSWLDIVDQNPTIKTIFNKTN